MVGLSKKANIFIGRNGHGKSNLFGALTYLFTDIMRKEERANIIHSMADKEHDQVSVEVSLDNKNRKMPFESDAVVFRRLWTPDDKDEFFINDKGLTKN